MAEYGNFSLSLPYQIDFPEEDIENIDPSIFDDPFEVEELSEAELSSILNEPTPVLLPDERQDDHRPKRFKCLKEEDLLNMSEQRYSKCTKKNTQWGYNTFTAWCKEKNLEVDLKTIEPVDLAQKLAIFYAEVAPKVTTTRLRKFPEAQAEEYHKNSLKNVRAAINRHIQVECGRLINIVTDSELKKANDMLNGKLKFNTKNGLSRSTEHKPIIPQLDMHAINQYLMQDNPITLRYRVWLYLSIHYVTCGLEFHSQLTHTSFESKFDETGAKYVILTHQTMQKNHPGDLNAKEENPDKTMYATGGQKCPVSSIKYYLTYINQKAESLFCYTDKNALENPQLCQTWYTTRSVGQRQFSNFMPDICRNANISANYTAHSLRATALNAMTDANLPARHIMSLSDNSSEHSLKPYTRPSTQHKQQMNKILSIVSSDVALTPPDSSAVPSQTSVNVQMTPADPTSTTQVICHTTEHNSLQALSEHTMNSMTGFIAHSTCHFNNCTFHFNHS